MAGAAAKKAAKAREQASGTYFPVLVGVNLWYALVRLYFRGGGRFHYAAAAGCLVIYLFTYSTSLEAAAQPDSLASYFFDVMALTAVAQSLGALTDRAWYLLLAVPAFALYKAVAWKFGGPAKPKEPEPAEDDVPAKGKEKKPKRKVMKGR